MTPALRVVGLAAALLAGSLALGALGCARSARHDQRQNPDVITFSHQEHVVKQGTACTDCHANVSAEQGLPDKVDAPKMAKCGDCHDVKDKAKCGLCHPDPSKPQTYAAWRRPPGKLVFKHRPHLPRAGGKCEKCHAQVVQTVRLSQITRPGHKECLACHEHTRDYRAMLCDKCHTNLRQFPIQTIATFNHEGNYVQLHKGPAKTNAGVCAQCHMERFCDDCHSRHNELSPAVRFPERVDRQLIHRGDWRTRHGIEQASNPGTCLKCHAQKQCMDCHRVEGVGQMAPNNRTLNTPGARPHPADWMNPVSANNHGQAARRNIVSCAGCHDRGAASNCVMCHRPGGAGGNPHPGGKPRGRDDKNQKMCRICHG